MTEEFLYMNYVYCIVTYIYSNKAIRIDFYCFLFKVKHLNIIKTIENSIKYVLTEL